ncbi:hypothetical protein GOBAR_AA36312 [Gossypium barbadense]|uniref:Uncharacterized protein n=1 Tax=Gossypium barbadense TaxID=3634 RepID=A0A2P5W013_GOSBA|nr:hypothetical protein GOBAR_AA36312 [Gossypium barbadense]
MSCVTEKPKCTLGKINSLFGGELINSSANNTGIMKVPGIWVFFFVIGTALFVFAFSSSSIPAALEDGLGMEFLQHVDGTSMSETSRKLKGSGYSPSNEKKSNVDVDDYDPIDPVPSSKASIKPGPIEHGSPLIPYIPKPSPPDHPKIGGST